MIASGLNLLATPRDGSSAAFPAANRSQPIDLAVVRDLGFELHVGRQQPLDGSTVVLSETVFIVMVGVSVSGPSAWDGLVVLQLSAVPGDTMSAPATARMQVIGASMISSGTAGRLSTGGNEAMIGASILPIGAHSVPGTTLGINSIVAVGAPGPGAASELLHGEILVLSVSIGSPLL